MVKRTITFKFYGEANRDNNVKPISLFVEYLFYMPSKLCS